MAFDQIEKISVGDETQLVHKITESEVQQFSALTGDTNPLHLDEAYSSTTPFGKRVVHGMLTASFISTIIGTKLPGAGALWYELQIRWLLPVRIGEEIRILVKVRQKTISLRTVNLEINIFNQSGKRVLEGNARVKMVEIHNEEEDMPREKGAVIVTGSSRGIGAAIAKFLAKDGFKVVVNYLSNEKEAEKTTDEILISGGAAMKFKADLRNSFELKNMLDAALLKFESLTGLVNNASISIDNKSFLELSWEDIQAHIDVQLKGAFELTQLTIPHFVDQGYGTVVNIGSVFADNVPPIRMLPYSLAKAALSSFSKSLALEYGPKNIRVNCVSPGMTHTDLIADVPEKAKMVTKMQTPLRRLANVDDIAGVVSFLFSEKARHITGETIRVCGGQVML